MSTRHRRLVFVIALLIVLTSPLASQTSALSSARAGTGPSITLESAVCDPAVGPSLGSRFSPIGFVYLHTGDFAVETVDIGNTARMAARFTRAYSSLDTRTTLLGPGWMENLEARIRSDGTQDLLFTLPNGNVERFKNALAVDRSVGTSRGNRVLTRRSDGSFLINDDATTWIFNSIGSLIMVEDGNGDWVEVRYRAETLESTLGPDGPGLLFRIVGDRLTQVTNAADQTAFVRFEYDDLGRLARSAPTSAAPRRYTYDGDSMRVTAILDDIGAVLLSIEYDDLHRVTTERDVQGLIDGEAVRFAYEDLPDGGDRTTVTYPPSLFEPGWHPVQIATHDSGGRLLELQLQPTSLQTFIGKYGYDSVNRRIILEDACRSVPPSVEPPDGTAQIFWLLGQIFRFFGR